MFDYRHKPADLGRSRRASQNQSKKFDDLTNFSEYTLLDVEDRSIRGSCSGWDMSKDWLCTENVYGKCASVVEILSQ